MLAGSSRRSRHQHQPTLYTLQNSHIKSLSSFPSPNLHNNSNLPIFGYAKADLFDRFRSIRRKATAVWKRIGSARNQQRAMKSSQNDFAPIMTYVSITPMQPQIPQLRMPLQVIPSRVSSLQCKPQKVPPTTAEIFEIVRFDHFKELLSGLDSHQETQIFAALMELKTKLLQAKSPKEEAPRRTAPSPLRAKISFAQTYGTAAFDVDSPSATLFSIDLEAQSSHLPDFNTPLSNTPSPNSPITASSAYLSQGSSQHSSQYSGAAVESANVIVEIIPRLRHSYCRCTQLCMRDDGGHLLETQQICDLCIESSCQRRLAQSPFILGSPPTPGFATRRTRPCQVDESTLTQEPHLQKSQKTDLEVVYEMMYDISFLQSSIQMIQDQSLIEIATESLHERYDLICHRSTDSGFINVSLDEAFEAMWCYQEIKGLSEELEGQPEGELRSESQQLISDMCTRIIDVLHV